MSTSTHAIYRGPGASGTGTIHPLRRLAAATLRLGDDRGRARLSTREHAITALLSWALVAGLYLDGWAHLSLYGGRLGAFLTPWHGLLYAGFASTSLWILSRNQRLRSWSFDRIPAGYGLSVLGMGIGFAGVTGDAAWHTLFGVEEGLARLLAPFHLVLFSGAALLIGAPLRAEWSRTPKDGHGSTRQLIPALVSLGALTALLAFILQFISPFVTWDPADTLQLSSGALLAEALQVKAMLGAVIGGTTLVLPLLVVLHRRRPPFGTGAILLGVVAAALTALNTFHHVALALGALAAGLVADLLILGLHGRLGEVALHRLVAIVTPSVLCLGCGALTRLSPALVTGAMALAAATGLLISHLMVTSVPLAREAEPTTALSRT